MRSIPSALAVLAFSAALSAAGDTAPASATVPLFDNLGTYHHTVTTSSPRAQQYFDQGLRLIYAFNHDEARRAFNEAARIDPQCAMAYWGAALSLGPNINLPRDPQRDAEALESMQQALALKDQVSPVERDYIEALSRRYSADPEADGKAMDLAYAGAMRELSRDHPEDPDAATLFAEALMDLRPWDLWTIQGQPQPGTAEIVATLEKVLKEHPDHPGANHYYIHTIEASPHPELGLPSAQRLPALMPGAGHLVHMPAHIYMRLGRYAEASQANINAAAVDREYIDKYKPQGIYPMMYYPHNLHFLWASASMEGRSAVAIKAARDVESNLSEDMMRQMPAMEFFAPTELLALARFGQWNDILQADAPAGDLQYAVAMWHYVRGLALAANRQYAAARKEQAVVESFANMMPADRIVGDNQPAVAHLQIAVHDLAGNIAARRGMTDTAVRELTAAVHVQDRLPYSEPPPWYYPERQALGAVLLDAKRPEEAEKVYREDLVRNPENGWSLYGLARALRAQQKTDEAAAVEARFQKAWAAADVKLSSSHF